MIIDKTYDNNDLKIFKDEIVGILNRQGYKTYGTLLSDNRWKLVLVEDPSIAAAIDAGAATIYINSYYYTDEKWNEKVVSFLIRHELLHLIKNHLDRSILLNATYDEVPDINDLKDIKKLSPAEVKNYTKLSYSRLPWMRYTVQNIAGDNHMSQWYTDSDVELVTGGFDFIGSNAKGLHLTTDDAYINNKIQNKSSWVNDNGKIDFERLYGYQYSKEIYTFIKYLLREKPENIVFGKVSEDKQSIEIDNRRYDIWVMIDKRSKKILSTAITSEKFNSWKEESKTDKSFKIIYNSVPYYVKEDGKLRYIEDENGNKTIGSKWLDNKEDYLDTRYPEITGWKEV